MVIETMATADERAAVSDTGHAAPVSAQDVAHAQRTPNATRQTALSSSGPGQDPLKVKTPVQVRVGLPNTHCKHGNRRSLGVCPDCANDKLAKRQRIADRAAFTARLAKILGD